MDLFLGDLIWEVNAQLPRSLNDPDPNVHAVSFLSAASIVGGDRGFAAPRPRWIAASEAIRWYCAY
jgi:hypothetical protein